MNIRNIIFWFKDWLQGGQIRKFYNDLNRSFEDKEYDNSKQLKSLLDYAIHNIEFYKNIKGETRLDSFPVVNKAIIKQNYTKFQSPLYITKKLHIESTSGSTGTPFKIYQNKEKRKRAAADMIFFSKFAGYEIGTRLYYCRVWNNLNKKSKISSVLQNIIMKDSSKLSDEEMMKFIKILEKDKSKKSILIFASTLTSLYKFLSKNKLKSNAKIESIISMSEALPEKVKKGMAEIFNTTVVARYSNCECGIIAQQCENLNEYHINKASFFVEMLKLDTDEPAEFGEIGRIVVTDLYNLAMPLIRYDTGDVGVLSQSSKCGRHSEVLTRIEGRRIDCIYATSGRLLSPYVINNTMWRFDNINQYQFIQEDKYNFLLKLNLLEKPFKREDEMIEEIRKYIGLDSNIRIEYVTEIPVLSSGKRKQVICNYIPK